MERSTFIQVPPDVTDVRTLKRFLDKLVLQLDIAFGNRGTKALLSIVYFPIVLVVCKSL